MKEQMEKKTDLWDDSALMNTFDQAICKYKKMHGLTIENVSTKEGKLDSRDQGNFFDVVDRIHEPIRDEDESSNAVSNTITAEMGIATNLSQVEESHYEDSHPIVQSVDLSNSLHIQDTEDAYSNAQFSDHYNQLLSQYYEIEEQRQKILEQLHQYSNWKYQSSGYDGVQWNVLSNSQENGFPSNQASYPTLVSSCDPNVCPSLVGPLESPAHADCDIVETTMGAPPKEPFLH